MTTMSEGTDVARTPTALTRKRIEMATAVEAGEITTVNTVRWFRGGEPAEGQSGRALRELESAGLIEVTPGAEPDAQGATPVTLTEAGSATLHGTRSPDTGPTSTDGE